MKALQDIFFFILGIIMLWFIMVSPFILGFLFLLVILIGGFIDDLVQRFKRRT